MLRNEADKLKRVVVCTPKQAYFETADIAKHNIAELELHPNSVFTRDTAMCTPNGYIKLRLGLPTRQGEDEWMSVILDSLGEENAGTITAPGTVEGGDVVLAGSVAFVGQSERTNADGIAQLSALLGNMDYEVRAIDLPNSILHLDKALMVVGKTRLLCCPELIPNGVTDGFDAIEVTYDGVTSANIICLGEDEVIVERSNHEVVKRLLAEGVTTHVLDLSEFAKGVGGPNCLILPVERWNVQHPSGNIQG